MKGSHNLLTPIVIVLSICGALGAQQQDALRTTEFRLEPWKGADPAGRELTAWQLCLNQYRVLVSGQKRYIPIYPTYTESCFKTIRDRAVDEHERAVNALDLLRSGESLAVLPAPTNGNFSGFGVWAAPVTQGDHPQLVFRADSDDVSRFGFRAQGPQDVATYVKDVFAVMITLFLEHGDPSSSPAMTYPYVKILKRVWLDARQHAEKIRNVPAERSAEEVNEQDIQEAIDMLSESQRLRLLGIALLIPSRG